MNYKRIYEEFIADRLLKQPDNNSYYEVHHIRPRCMNGGNEPSNLIRLTYSDHLFAHILLARAYRDTEYAFNLHGALLMLSRESLKGTSIGNGKRVGSLAIAGVKGSRLRRLIEETRKARKVCQMGDNHPSADKTIFSFENSDGRSFSGTRSAFIAKYALNASTVSRLIKDEWNASKCGWRVRDQDKTDEERIKEGDATRYVFKNMLSGATYKGTRRTFKKHTNMEWWLVHAIVDNRGASPGGWLIQ